jgi:hypothetical protein
LAPIRKNFTALFTPSDIPRISKGSFDFVRKVRRICQNTRRRRRKIRGRGRRNKRGGGRRRRGGSGEGGGSGGGGGSGEEEEEDASGSSIRMSERPRPTNGYYRIKEGVCAIQLDKKSDAGIYITTDPPSNIARGDNGWEFICVTEGVEIWGHAVFHLCYPG